jgi:hypothetical protein
MRQAKQKAEGKRPATGLLLLAAMLFLAYLGVSAEGKKREKRKTRKKKTTDASGFLVHPYLQLPTPTGITVMWETRSDGPSRVEFGTTRKLGYRTEKKKRTYLHEVRLNKLKPATTYFYRVHSGQLTSEIYSFKTAPPVGTKRFRIAVYGDSRSNPKVHGRIAQQVARRQVDLILHTGDIVVNGKIHKTWRREFFEPLGGLARSVPWVSTIGNHENDSENYFSYMALPGNKRYFGFDYANAHIICLDSNSWIAKGRDSKQYQWLEEHLHHKRQPAWTLVAFHHPLFSAHASRPINSLRWDWAPLFLDPANRVDGVLAGHDHFYARNYRMGRVAEKPVPGVLFVTTGGGGAGLYRSKKRDYVAREKMVHHFTLLDFARDRVKVSGIDLNGKVIDEYTLTKEPTPAEEFCAYEIEELRKFLRLALAKQKPARPVPIEENQGGRGNQSAPNRFRLAGSFQVPTRFRIPMWGTLRWQVPRGWKVKSPTKTFQLKPSQALVIPLDAEVAAGAFAKSPTLTIEFAPGKFRNRTIQVAPFKIAGPEKVRVPRVKEGLVLDARQPAKAWQTALHSTLLPLAGTEGIQDAGSDHVQFLADADWLYVRVQLSDPKGEVQLMEPDPCAEGSRLVLGDEHVRVALIDGKTTRCYAISPGSLRFYSCNQKEDSTRDWRAVVGKCQGGWCVQFALPRKFQSDLEEVRVNVTHRRRLAEAKSGRKYLDMELWPTYRMGSDCDRLPDWQATEGVDGARLSLE